MSIMPRRACVDCEPLVSRLQDDLLASERRSLQVSVDASVVQTWQRERIAELEARVAALEAEAAESWRRKTPVDLVLHCPACGKQHLDVGEFRTRVHRKHLCENTPDGPKTGCGHLWVPHEYATRGVWQVGKAEDS